MARPVSPPEKANQAAGWRESETALAGSWADRLRRPLGGREFPRGLSRVMTMGLSRGFGDGTCGVQPC
eukprot:3279212-Lingulodinium_polyedra.AAC.1